jgi:hypothetical protein
MDTSIAPKYPVYRQITSVARSRFWTCPRYVSIPATVIIFAAVIAGMHFVARPIAARYATCQMADCRP